MENDDQIMRAFYEANIRRIQNGAPITEQIKQDYNSNGSNIDNVNINANANANLAPQYLDVDQLMPITIIDRIMRQIIPPDAKLSQESKELVQQCATDFISFVTSEANDHCRNEFRKTLTADDILCALSKLGFDNYVHTLARFLKRYRHTESSPDANENHGARRTPNIYSAMQIISKNNMLPQLQVPETNRDNYISQISEVQQGFMGASTSNQHHFQNGSGNTLGGQNDSSLSFSYSFDHSFPPEY